MPEELCGLERHTPSPYCWTRNGSFTVLLQCRLFGARSDKIAEGTDTYGAGGQPTFVTIHWPYETCCKASLLVDEKTGG